MYYQRFLFYLLAALLFHTHPLQMVHFLVVQNNSCKMTKRRSTTVERELRKNKIPTRHFTCSPQCQFNFPKLLLRTRVSK